MVLDQTSRWAIKEAVKAEGREKELEVVYVVMDSGIFRALGT